MKSFLLLLVLGLATSDKLDRTYLPPLGSKLAGGSPGAIQIPFEYPKESYQTTRRPFVNLPGQSELYQFDSFQNNQGSDGTLNKASFPISRVPTNYPQQPFSGPTTTTSYAFTQTTTFPLNEGFETTVAPFVQLQNTSTLNQAPDAYKNVPSTQDFQNGQLVDQNSAFFQPTNQEPEFVQTNKNNVNSNISQQRPIVYQSQPQIENLNKAQQPHHLRPGSVSKVLSNENRFNYQSEVQTPNNVNNKNTFVPSLPSSSQTIPGSPSYQNDDLKYSSPDDDSNQLSDTRPLISENRQPDYLSSTSSSLSMYTTISGDDFTTPMQFEVSDKQNEYDAISSKSINRPERPRSELDRNAVILSYENVITPEGYAYSYDTSNGIHADESASTTNGVKAQGSYSYIGDDGKEYSVIYTADENGFQPRGDHLPTPPPIPEAIKRVIEQAARDEKAGIIDDGTYDESKYGYKNYETGSKKGQQVPLKKVSKTGNARFENNVPDYLQQDLSLNQPTIISNNKISNGTSSSNSIDLNDNISNSNGFRTQNEVFNGVSKNGYPGDSAKPITTQGLATSGSDVDDKITSNTYAVTKYESDLNQMFPKQTNKQQLSYPIVKTNIESNKKEQASPNQINSGPVKNSQMEFLNPGTSKDTINLKSEFNRPNTMFSKNIQNQQPNLLSPDQKTRPQNGYSFTTAMLPTPNERITSNVDQPREQNSHLPSHTSTVSTEQILTKELSLVGTSPKTPQELFKPNTGVSNQFDKLKNSEGFLSRNMLQDLPNSNRFENNNQLRFQRPDSSLSQNVTAKSVENKSKLDTKNYDFKPIGAESVFRKNNKENNDVLRKPSEGYQYFPPQNQFTQENLKTFPSQSSFSMKNTDFIEPPRNLIEKNTNNQRPPKIQNPAQNGHDFNDKDYEYLEDDDLGKPYSSIKSVIQTTAITTSKPEFFSTFLPKAPTRVSQNYYNQQTGFRNKPNSIYEPSTTSFPPRSSTTEPSNPTTISSQYSSTTPIPRSVFTTPTPSPVFINRDSELPLRNNERKSQNRIPTSTYRPQYDVGYISTPEFGMKILPGNQKVNQFTRVNQNSGILLSEQNRFDPEPTYAGSQLPQPARPSNGLKPSIHRPNGSVSQPYENVKVSSVDETTPLQVIGEDFTGPKQRQRFDPKTGYHY